MSSREPAVAGTFYPSDAPKCREQAEHYLSMVVGGEAMGTGGLVGGLVPHAGWVCSGAVAAEVMRQFSSRDIDTFVVFGAVHHRGCGDRAAAWVAGSWQTPLGEMAVDEELAREIVQRSPLVIENPQAHSLEHSIEVELPFLQILVPEAKLCPVMVPPTRAAHEVGRVVAEAAATLDRKVAFLGSTDLTHYGPRYHFTPMGVGIEGTEWAKDVNDRRFIDLVLSLQAEQVVEEAAEHRNACGSGAVAATIAACQAHGAKNAKLLRHTNSHEVLRHLEGAPQDSVGYAGILFSD